MSTDIHTLAGAYVLDALTDIERAEFDRHLATCPACTTEVAELRETAARLGDLTAVAPPARLKADVLAQVGRTRQAAPGYRDAGRATNGTPRRRWALAAAAAVLIAAGSGTAGYVARERQAPPAATQSSQAAQVLAILRAADARVTTQQVTGGRVTVVVSDTLDRGVALVNALPSPGDRAYQLWLIKGVTPVSVGLLAAGATGTTQVFADPRGAVAFGISKEPPTGSPTPTQPLVTSFPLACASRAAA
ncbi:MAG TPA: anti-sigma factor [Rugosimonospora sp.]|jgi:anti-sigma-K factor RskA